MGLSLEWQGGVGSSGGRVFDEISHEKPRRVAARQHEIHSNCSGFFSRKTSRVVPWGWFFCPRAKTGQRGGEFVDVVPPFILYRTKIRGNFFTFVTRPPL